MREREAHALLSPYLYTGGTAWATTRDEPQALSLTYMFMQYTDLNQTQTKHRDEMEHPSHITQEIATVYADSHMA